jgi:hypothetical protein
MMAQIIRAQPSYVSTASGSERGFLEGLADGAFEDAKKKYSAGPNQ